MIGRKELYPLVISVAVELQSSSRLALAESFLAESIPFGRFLLDVFHVLPVLVELSKCKFLSFLIRFEELDPAQP